TPKGKDAAFKANYPEMTDQEILDEQWEKRKSSVYDHYLKPKLVYDNGVVKYGYQCKSHPNDSSCLITRARYDTATSNLVNHRDSCEKKIAPPAQAITAYTNGGHYNKGELRLDGALWIARRNRAYKIIADPELVHMFHVANKNVVLPSAKTIARDVIRVHDKSIPVIANHLKAILKKNFVHLSFDGWTASNVKSFFDIVVHHANDVGDIVSFTLDFAP
ncbi:hypothetical protein K435DRAFT_587820, partial [Dendrothele bispora CBS 962.96]